MKRTRKRSRNETEDSQDISDKLKTKNRKLSTRSKGQEEQTSLGHSRRKSCNEQDIERGREPKRRVIAEGPSRYQGQKRSRTSSHDEDSQVIQKRVKLSSSAKLGHKSERKSAGKSGQISPLKKQALKRSMECDLEEQVMKKRPKLSSSAKLGQKSERKSAGKISQSSPPRNKALKRSRDYDDEEEQVRQKKGKVSSGKEEEKTNKPKGNDECITGGSTQPVVESKKPLPLSVTGYLFHKVLGQGSFGQVVLASTKDTGQVVAIKLIKKAKVEEKTIQKENRILQMASGSPFLCQGLAAFQTREYTCLVMEYIPGDSLQSYMAGKEHLSMEEARFISANLVCGIQYLHARGILHRDLKPANILFDAKGYVKIADFGLCEENIFTDTTTNGRAGTVKYMAPEVLSYKEYGHSADWWSFGVILHYMITGQNPFNTKISKTHFINEVLNADPCYPTWLGSDTIDFLSKLLDKDPCARVVVGRNIREHPFFKDINWEDLERGKVSCPFLTLLTPETGTTGK
ncbi:protein kinase C theta type-like [Pelobates fuscus]|uniref:protein kinase C theta type-like n=1 Tax=Pelobates fuscus TaxID=191477 RepID=UPI002FE4D382